jgi:hypothetical protein
MRHKTTQTLLDYFNRVRGARSAPLRADIDPVALKTVLSSVFMLEMQRNGTLRVRLAGTQVCTILGREVRGEDFNLLWTRTDRHKMKIAAETVLANQMPLVIRLRALADDETAIDLEMILLPLSSAPGLSDRMFGSLAPLSAGPKREEHRVLRPDTIDFLPADWSASRDVEEAEPADGTEAQVAALQAKAMRLRVIEGGKGRGKPF